MAFLDELKDKVSDAALVAGKAATDVYEATKVKVAIAEKKGMLRLLYRELGEIVYSSYKHDTESAEAVEDKIVEIDSALEGIEALKEQQLKIKKVHICAGCGSEIPDGCNFCPKCGRESEKEDEDESVEAVVVDDEADEADTEETQE